MKKTRNQVRFEILSRTQSQDRENARLAREGTSGAIEFDKALLTILHGESLELAYMIPASWSDADEVGCRSAAWFLSDTLRDSLRNPERYPELNLSAKHDLLQALRYALRVAFQVDEIAAIEATA